MVDPALVAELVAAQHRDDPLEALGVREQEVLALMAEATAMPGSPDDSGHRGDGGEHVRSILTKLSFS